MGIDFPNHLENINNTVICNYSKSLNSICQTGVTKWGKMNKSMPLIGRQREISSIINLVLTSQI